MSPVLPEVCHRTRQQVSLRLDSELSELEEALVASHLARCATCNAFADDLEAFTGALRAAPPAESSVSFKLPRRSSRVGAVAYAGSAAAAAITVAVALSGVMGFHSSPTRISAFELRTARAQMSVQEQRLQALQGTISQRVRRTPPGLEAAETTTLDGSQSAK